MVMAEKLVNYHLDVAASGIQKKRNAGKFARLYQSRVSTSHLRRRRPQQQELFVEERHDFQFFFRHRERNEAEVEAAIQKAGHNIFGNGHGYANFCIGKLLSKLSQRASELINQCRYA